MGETFWQSCILSVDMPKPRSRQRIVYCDCFDCIDRPDAVSTSAESLSAAEAVARQLPPPKALILFGSGFLRHFEGSINLDACSFPHLDRVAREGCLGMLALQSMGGRCQVGRFMSGVSRPMHNA